MDNVLDIYINMKYKSHLSILKQWDSIFILFENGHFGWFYLDIDNETTINNDTNNSSFIVWIISPNCNRKYDEFLNQLTQKSKC